MKSSPTLTWAMSQWNSCPNQLLVPHGNHRVGEQRRTAGEARPDQVEQLVALGGCDVLLEEELQAVGGRLEHPERTDPVGAVAQLDARRDLAFGEGQIRERRQQEDDQDTALDEQDPPEIVGPDHATASAVKSARPPLPARP